MAPRTNRTRQRARELSITQRKERFLQELAKRANVTAAASKAGVPRSTVYDWHAADPEFAAAWAQAIEVAVDGLEHEAWRRAATGFLEPVFQKGEQVGQIRRYSDTLMITLLKAHRAEKYRERSSTELTGAGGEPLQGAVVNVYLPDNGRSSDGEPE